MKKLVLLMLLVSVKSISQNDPVTKSCNTLVDHGVYYANKNQWTEALKRYSLAVEMCPDLAIAYHNRAIAKQNMEDYRSASQDYMKAIELNTLPVDIKSESHYGLGMCLFILGFKEDACQEFSAAGELGYQTAYNVIKKYCQ